MINIRKNMLANALVTQYMSKKSVGLKIWIYRVDGAYRVSNKDPNTSTHDASLEVDDITFYEFTKGQRDMFLCGSINHIPAPQQSIYEKDDE